MPTVEHSSTSSGKQCSFAEQSGRSARRRDRRSIPPELQQQPLILASRSPRRARLLRLAGLPFEVWPCPREPQYLAGGAPEQLALQYASYKAAWVAARQPGRLVLGADTVVAVDGDVLGKPCNRAEAYQMLQRLAGRSHRVHTAFALVMSRRRRVEGLWRECVSTQVKFYPLRPTDITEYVSNGEPLDKAGAYGIQDQGRSFVERIRGSYYNVVGLPIDNVCKALHELGWKFVAWRQVPSRR